MTEFRLAIIKLFEIGMPKWEISRLLDVPEKIVRYAIKRFQETGSNENLPKEHKKRTARTVKNKRQIQVTFFYFYSDFLFLRPDFVETQETNQIP